MNEAPILDMLDRYVRRSGERWHTPGHKGVEAARGGFLDWAHDITEIEEMLTSPNPVQRSEQLMAEALGVDRTWYSVQGASLPVTAGILAAFPPGSTLWVDRTLHRSVLSALVLGQYRVHWLYPRFLAAGLSLPLTEFPHDFAPAVGLILTRPTYDGLASDVGETIERAHRQGLTVVVDEAHGSHWHGASYPSSAVWLGADLITHGTHKTDAALTQTGLLHLRGHRVASDEIDRWWRLLSTSSPSYLLLASLDRLQWERRQEGLERPWERLAHQARALWNTMESQGAVVLQAWAERAGYVVDPARLTILGHGSALRHRLAGVGEVEKVTPGSCTLILAPGQNMETLERALTKDGWAEAQDGLADVLYPRLGTALPICEAWNKAGQWVPLGESVGCVAKDAVTPYPPGIPMAVPGEVLTREMIEWLTHWMAADAGPIQGLKHREGVPCVSVVAP